MDITLIIYRRSLTSHNNFVVLTIIYTFAEYFTVWKYFPTMMDSNYVNALSWCPFTTYKKEDPFSYDIKEWTYILINIIY